MASQITTPTSQTNNDFNASDNSVVSTVTPLGANGAPSGEPSVESFKNSHITPTGEIGSVNNNDESVTGNASTGGQNMGISTGSKRLDSIATGLLVAVTAAGGGCLLYTSPSPRDRG